MTASDTVIGIVGAVVLVAVMAGVFVYEYNNVEATDTDDPDGGNGGSGTAMLDDDGDIDGDGLRNVEDDDVDGDGIPNAEDRATEVTFHFTGNVGTATTAGTGADIALHSLPTEMGASALAVTFAVSSSDPTGATADVDLEVTTPAGTSGTVDGSGSTSFMDPGAGNVDLRVFTPSVAAGIDYTIDVTVTYG